MIDFESVPDLAEIVRGTIADGCVLVGFDGIDGAGKTYVSDEVATLLGWRLIHLDDYVNRDQGTYVENLRYRELLQDIESDRAPLLIEGVCLLEVIERLGISLTKHIYVKRVNSHGLWIDEGECDFSMSAEQKIAELDAQTKLVSQFMGRSARSDEDENIAGLTEFRKEVIRYHAVRKPARFADHVYCRREIDA